MCKDCKILILEDEETDAELIMDQIMRTDSIWKFKVTDNEVGFKRLIDEFKPDLILSDYSLPTYDGMSALAYVLEYTPETPVVVVTGSINEETAVAAMKAGAVDYILKDKMGRLGLAVKTALKNKDIQLQRKHAKEQLVAKEKYYRDVISHLHEDLMIIDENYVITDINNSFLTTTGKKREDVVGKHCYEVSHDYTSPCSENGEICHLQEVFANKQPKKCLHKHRRTDGEKTWVDILLSPMFDEEGNVRSVIEACRNVDDIIKAQDEIKKLSTIVDQSPLAVVLMDNDGLVKYVNPAFTKLTEYNPKEIIGKLLKTIGADDLSLEEHDSILKNSLNGNLNQKNFKNRKKSGEIFFVTSNFARYYDSNGHVNGLIAMMNDITKSVKDQKQIENDLKEKELLLQEIYHRVNNNMQIMISLLNMQIDRTELDGEKDVLRIAQSRVGAISAIHNDIYQERSFAAINFGNVTRHIFNTLCESLMISSGNIELKVDAAIPDFGLDLAQPSALIVNELISNCLIHAYPGGTGSVYVNLTIDEFEELTLIVKDNGIGISESIDPEKSDTTGFSLVYMLAIGQLDGSVDIKRDKGTTVTIKFKRINDKKRF